MTFAYKPPEGDWIEIADAVQLPGFAGSTAPDYFTVTPDWVAGLSPEECADFGLIEVAEIPVPDDPGLRVVGFGVEDVEGVPTRTWQTEALPVPTLEELKAAKLAAAESEYAARLALGFPVPSLGVGETLQLRSDHDRTNWLALKDSCNDAILAGFGAEPCPLPIRTTANTTHALTFNAAAQMMRDLRAWGAAMMGVLWGLKDAIGAAEDAEALDAIDVTEGWPE